MSRHGAIVPPRAPRPLLIAVAFSIGLLRTTVSIIWFNIHEKLLVERAECYPSTLPCALIVPSDVPTLSIHQCYLSATPCIPLAV